MRTIRLRLFGPPRLLAAVDAEERPLPVQPKPLALLAYLALEGRNGGVRRDALLALFWPELDEPRARASLRQALFHLRRVLGAEALPTRGDGLVSLAVGALACDAAAFDDALAAGALARAVAAYDAPLLDAFRVDGVAPELEQWADAARDRYTYAARGAAWTLARRAESGGAAAEAARWARAALAMDPTDPVLLERAVEMMLASGDRALALEAVREYARRAAHDDETGATPLMDTLRARIRSAADTPGSSRIVSAPSPAARSASGGVLEPPPAPLARRAWPRRARLMALTLAAIGFAALAIPSWRPLRDAQAADAIAVRPAARALYLEALDRFHAQSDVREAARLFEAALREDSTCAICAYYASRARLSFDEIGSRAMLRRAVHLADRARPLERLLIRLQWAEMANDPSRLALAESLATLVPGDAEADLALGRALHYAGRPLEAIPHLLHALSFATDGARSARGALRCVPCDARDALVHAYWDADSLDAAMRVARAWTREAPASMWTWLTLAQAEMRAGRIADARRAIDRLGDDSRRGAPLLERARVALYAGDHEHADSLLRAFEASGTRSERVEALWWRAVALRYEGRPAAALALIQGPLRWANVEANGDQPAAAFAHGLLEGQTLLEAGRARDAATVYRQLAPGRFADELDMPGLRARRRVWALTHAATASAVAGDTAAVAAIRDTVRVEGMRSALGRDQRLHHYIDGLLWEARGRVESAAAAFHRARSSPVGGFTRASREEARMLLALGRPREAIAALVAAVHGDMDASALYVTRPELHALLADAYEADGEADSARAHRTQAERAWRLAESTFRAPRLAHR